MVKIEELIDNSDLTVLNKNLLFNFVFRAKEDYIRHVANKWKNQITEECYQALLNYKIEITD